MNEWMNEPTTDETTFVAWLTTKLQQIACADAHAGYLLMFHDLAPPGIVFTLDMGLSKECLVYYCTSAVHCEW